MSQETTTVRASIQDGAVVREESPAGSGGGSSGSILPQVSGWAGAARESRSACERAANAAQKLRSRRNTSGE
jgi:hypothetical protein